MDKNMHMTVADMFNLMTKHATYLRDNAYNIPAAMQQLNSTYMDDIYPYKPDVFLTRLMNTPIDSEEKKEQLKDLLRCSDDAMLMLRDIIGFEMSTATTAVTAWGKAFEARVATYPFGKESLYHEGYTIADIAAPAQYLRLISPDLRDLQRAINLASLRCMQPDEWIWLGGRRLNKALRAYLVFVGDDTTTFDASLVDQPERVTYRLRLSQRIKQRVKKSLRRQSSH